MLDLKLFENARWQDLYQFFLAGEEPLVWRLLVINTVVLTLFIVRRARGEQPLRTSTVYIVQGLLIAANMFVMFAPQMFGVEHLSRYLV
jgi:hypothetical protein